MVLDPIPQSLPVHFIRVQQRHRCDTYMAHTRHGGRGQIPYPGCRYPFFTMRVRTHLSAFWETQWEHLTQHKSNSTQENVRICAMGEPWTSNSVTATYIRNHWDSWFYLAVVHVYIYIYIRILDINIEPRTQHLAHTHMIKYSHTTQKHLYITHTHTVKYRHIRR